MKHSRNSTSRNVFARLGFSAGEAENLKVRSTLMTSLTTLIAERGLTQKEAAKMLGVTQPRISDLVCGKIDRFSVDMLILMLTAAGAEVRVSVKRTKAMA
jgi:predicted XRE-type DNA-binding protein